MVPDIEVNKRSDKWSRALELEWQRVPGAEMITLRSTAKGLDRNKGRNKSIRKELGDKDRTFRVQR